MKLNATMTKTMRVTGSRTVHRQSPLFTIGGTVLKESDDFYLLGVIFVSILTRLNDLFYHWANANIILPQCLNPGDLTLELWIGWMIFRLVKFIFCFWELNFIVLFPVLI